MESGKQRSNLKRMRFRILLAFLLGISVPHLAKAQDPNFSQFYAAPLYLNPALAGAEKDAAFSAVYRSQWRSLGFPQQMGQFSGIIPLHSRRQPLMQQGGIGFAVYSDAAGEGNNFRTTGVQAGAAYNLPLTGDFAQVLSFGMQVGLIQKSIDFDALRWGSQYEPMRPYFGFNPAITPSLIQDNGLKDRVLYPVIHSGIVWHFNPASSLFSRPFSGFVGFSASNMNRPNESLIREGGSRLPVLWRLQGGLACEITQKIGLLPNLLWMRQNGLDQINVGTYVSYKLTDAATRSAAQAMLGGWYRVNDSFVMAAALTNAKYTLGFSYDINTSSLRYATHGRGAWEVSLTRRITKNNTARRFATPLI